MNNFLFARIILHSICLLAIQQGITANTNGCKTPKLGPAQPLLITIFDSEDKLQNVWDPLCQVITQFPKGLVTIEYRAGALASGTVNNIKCGSGDCKLDQLNGCESLTKNYNECIKGGPKYDWGKVMRCYCKQEINKLLLDNAALRASWSIPDNAVPTLAVNKVYDPCFKFSSYADVLNYLCQVYQKKVGPC